MRRGTVTRGMPSRQVALMRPVSASSRREITRRKLEPFLGINGGVTALGRAVVFAFAGNHQQPLVHGDLQRGRVHSGRQRQHQHFNCISRAADIDDREGVARQRTDAAGAIGTKSLLETVLQAVELGKQIAVKVQCSIHELPLLALRW